LGTLVGTRTESLKKEDENSVGCRVRGGTRIFQQYEYVTSTANDRPWLRTMSTMRGTFRPWSALDGPFKLSAGLSWTRPHPCQLNLNMRPTQSTSNNAQTLQLTPNPQPREGPSSIELLNLLRRRLSIAHTHIVAQCYRMGTSRKL